MFFSMTYGCPECMGLIVAPGFLAFRRAPNGGLEGGPCILIILDAGKEVDPTKPVAGITLFSRLVGVIALE